MYKITILFGVLLIATGLGGYFGTGSEQPTALIPAGIGIVLLICGVLAANENRRMMAMHIAVLFGLLGAIGVIPVLFKENQPQAALISKLVTLVLCLVFVGLCVQSFIAARKAREAAEQTQSESPEDSAPDEE
tara:strand:+ start:1304 stop:1702 length:399 start_codon:yes stop_codon:yes gene_type:complete